MKTQLALALACSLTAAASAQTVSTTFARSEGFTSRSFAPVTLTEEDFSVTFTGGVQEQSFDGPAYSNGPDAFFFINSGPTEFTGSFGVRPLAGSTDVGTVSFSRPVSEVSFNAADRANGVPSLRVLGVDGGVLETVAITATSNRLAASRLSFSAEDLGGLIGGIEFDNAGPNQNPSYVIAIDSFSATAAAAVPEPSSLAIGSLLLGLVGVGRRVRG